MGEQTAISWCDHTFNPWWGCSKVSDGCKHCYAETLANRWSYNIWGNNPRRPMSANYWRQLGKWHKQAKERGVRASVFCASMADVFEDHPQVGPWRDYLLDIIPQYEWLDFLLLTKRPENMIRFAPTDWKNAWPENVIAMTSVENQAQANKRIPQLRDVPAKRRGLSCEPLLGALDLSSMLDGIHWVITGGESGSKARPMHPEWARSLRDQCASAGVAYHFKQWGEFVPRDQLELVLLAEMAKCYIFDDSTIVHRVGKHNAGRLLDGVEHNGYPSR